MLKRECGKLLQVIPPLFVNGNDPLEFVDFRPNLRLACVRRRSYLRDAGDLSVETARIVSCRTFIEDEFLRRCHDGKECLALRDQRPGPRLDGICIS